MKQAEVRDRFSDEDSQDILQQSMRADTESIDLSIEENVEEHDIIQNAGNDLLDKVANNTTTDPDDANQEGTGDRF